MTELRPQQNNKPSVIFTTGQLHLIAFFNYYSSFSKIDINEELFLGHMCNSDYQPAVVSQYCSHVKMLLVFATKQP